MQVQTEREPSFGERLRRLREGAGLTQEALAERAGLSVNAVSDLERGRRTRPYPHTVTALATALSLDTEQAAVLRAAVASRRGGQASTDSHDRPGVPSPPNALVGRVDDVRALTTLLRRDDTRLVSLTGPGGVGKTRLALEVAGTCADGFPDGVAFVELAPVADAALVLPTIVEALRLRESGSRSALELLRTYLAGRRMLLVLDNLEHLPEAVHDIGAVLSAQPSVTVLATSRAPLRLRGERVHPVRPLPVPDPDEIPDLTTVVASPAAELFVERCREVDPDFELSRKNAAVVAAICWRLDGLPLALELAAARAGYLAPTDLLARLDQALRSTGGARDLPERHRSLQATLDWSHDLLTDSEQALLRRLSVFAGGFTLPAAEAVGADEVFDTLATLVDQSLVTARPSRDEGPSRYGLLEPVRQYASEKLGASGEEALVRGRHARYFERLAEQAGSELKGPDQAAWMDLLATEHDNLRAALRHLLDSGEPERACAIGWHVHRFWSLRGHTAEGRAWLEDALTSPLPDRPRAQALYAVGMLSFVRGEMDRAGTTAERSAQAARAAGDAEVLASALMGRGLTALSTGDLETAASLLSEVLDSRHGGSDPSVVALTLVGLARIALAARDIDRGQQLLCEAEQLARAHGDWFTLAGTLISRALVARQRGDDELAGALLRESIEHVAELRDAWHILLSVTGLAGVATRHGQPHLAMRLLGAVEALSQTLGVDVPGSMWGDLDRADLDRARELLGPTAVQREWQRGRSMALHDVIAEALLEQSS